MDEIKNTKRISLLERELGVLVEDLDKSKLDFRSELDLLRIELEALKAFLMISHPEFSEEFKRVKSETLFEKNPEWISGRQ
jgi:hypothetical protein